MKKTISIILMFLLVLQINVLADQRLVKNGDDLKLSIVSEEFPDAYIEQNLFVFNEDVKLVNGKLESDTKDTSVLKAVEEVNNSSEMIKEIRNSFEENTSFLGIAEATIYVKEGYEFVNNQYVYNSKILSKSEIEEIKSQNNGIIIWETDEQSKSKLTLKLMISNNSESTNVDLTCKGIASWSGLSTVGSQGPAGGDDFMAFLWGGEFDFRTTGQTIKYSDPIGQKNDEISTSSSAANAGVSWSFTEILGMTDQDFYATNVTVNAKLTKNTLTGNGNTTSVALQYVHTYPVIIPNLTADINDSGTFPIFSVSGTKSQWNLQAILTGYKY